MQTIDSGDVKKIGSYLQYIGQKRGIDILFCIIPNGGPTYSHIKQLAEIDHGVLTQCIKGATVGRIVNKNDLSSVSNILLKDNAKLNGTNHKLATSPILAKNKIMIIGADVTHPSPGQNDIPRYLIFKKRKENCINFV